MATWNDVTESSPEFAEAVRAIFDAHRHKTLATLREDGSPRISGTEATFHAGDLWLGMMPESRKALDLRRDPRLALHSATVVSESWSGDAKVSGRAVEVNDPAIMQVISGGESQEDAEPSTDQGSHLFRIDIADVVLTRVGDPADHLVIEYWRDGHELQRIKRR